MSISNHTSKAWDILKSQGVYPLLKQTSLYLLFRTDFGEKWLYENSLEAIQRRIEKEDSIDNTLDTLLVDKPGLAPYQLRMNQFRDEVTKVVSIVQERKPETMVEIGTARGGSLYLWCRCLESLEEAISVDIPGGPFGGGSEYDARHEQLFQSLFPNTNISFIRGDSQSGATRDDVLETATGDIDFLFIDGDHSYEGVTTDFKLYSDLVADGGVVVLDDIRNEDFDVSGFWSDIRDDYETRELVSNPDEANGGLGIVNV